MFGKRKKQDLKVGACDSLKHKPRFRLSPSRSRINSDVIKWHVNDYHPDLDQGLQLSQIKEAFQMWHSAFFPIEFATTSEKGEANIVIYFGSDNDPQDLPPLPFGEESTLAYAFFPVNNKSDIWMDRDEDWNLAVSRRGISMKIVVAHELGHSFGISHDTEDPDDLMNPFYNPDAEITQDSRNAVKSLYGDIQDRISAPPTPPAVPPVLPPEPDPEPEEEDEIDYKDILKKTFSSRRDVIRLRWSQRVALAEGLGVSVTPTFSLSNRLYVAIQNL